MKKDIEHIEMASAVIWWLNYISAVGRKYVINENSIKYPVAEYLEKSICEKNNIKLEHPHPILKSRSLDLYYKKDLEETAFEFKFIKNGSTTKQSEKQRVFNDLMRLHYFLESGGTKAYFLICGMKSEFKNSFMKIPSATALNRQLPNSPIVSSPFYEEWFSFNDKPRDKAISLNNSNDPYKNIYAKYFNDYKAKKGKTMKPPKSVKTKMIFISQEIIDSNIPENLRIGIWEVLL